MIDWIQLQRYQRAMTLGQWAIAIVTISLAMWMIVWIRSYFREDADDADETLEMLTQFRELHQEGGLSDDEFRLIRCRLTSKAQKALVADRTTPNEITGKLVPTNLAERKEVSSGQLPVQDATEEKEKEEESERMSDEKTE